MQRKKDSGSSKVARWLVPAAFVVGIIFVLMILDLTVGIPAPTPSQFTGFRIVVALGGVVVVGPALRFALNALPFGLRRATFRAGQRRKKNQNQNKKGDTSNEVTKGTFLTRFDKRPLQTLTQTKGDEYSWSPSRASYFESAFWQQRTQDSERPSNGRL